MTKKRRPEEEAIALRDQRINRVPKLTNRKEAREGNKPKTKITELNDNRAVVLNFTRHAEPRDLIPLLQQNYRHIRLFTPVKELYVVDHVDHTQETKRKIVSNAPDRGEETKSQQISKWLKEFLTTKRNNNTYPLDFYGDYYVILPQKDAQMSVEILTALQSIKNIDWLTVWTVFDENTQEFIVSEVVSTKGIFSTWKKQVAEVTDITNRRKGVLMTKYSQLETEEERKEFIDSLSDEEYLLCEFALKRRIQE